MNDLDSRSQIHDLVVRFYREIVFDELLGPVFGEVAEVARGVATDGLRYPLRHEDLVRGSTRGVSNELTERRGSVEIGDGLLLVATVTRRSVASR